MERERRHSGDFEAIDTSVPLESITVPTILNIAESYLMDKGCVFTTRDNGIVITFPAGTVEQRIWPTTLMERYRVILPTQCELRIVRDREDVIRALYVVNVEKPAVQALMRQWA